MPRLTLRHRVGLAAGTAALVVGALSVPGAGASTAEPTSTPVSITAPDGTTMS